jgi:hypothetical protein
MKRSPGGQPGHTVSAETRAKISAKLRARKVSDAERAQQLENLAKGRTQDVMAARRGRTLTEEHKAKIGRALKRLDPECSVDGCDSPAKAYNMCPMHYGRWKNHGDPLAEPRRAEAKYESEAYNWRGDEVGYDAVHIRMKKSLPSTCALADESCKGRLEVAFRGHDTPLELWRYHEANGRTIPFSTNPDHYWRLCRSHHVRLDHGKLDL